MTLYVCMGGDYDGDWVTAIFDTREAAEAHLVQFGHAADRMRADRIEEYPLNTLSIPMSVHLSKLAKTPAKG